MVNPLEVFDGVMLGDGGIRPTTHSARFRMSQAGTKHMDWLRMVHAGLLDLGVDCDEPSTETMTYKGEPRVYSYLSSRTSEFLDEQRQRWYPNGRKEVPEDLILTPECIANWFAGDGSSNWYQRKPTHRRYVYAYLHTYGFSVGSINRLVGMLTNAGIFGWTFRRRKTSGSGIALQLCNPCNVNKLMDLVGPHIVPSFQYKIKRVPAW